jgi:hypothetical protein
MKSKGDLSTAIDTGLVRTAEDALTVLRQASRPLGPMGAEWLQRQERQIGVDGWSEGPRNG